MLGLRRSDIQDRVDQAREVAAHRLESMATAVAGHPPAVAARSAQWPLLLAALGVGVVLGALGTLVLKSRSSHWDEYEPVTVLGMDDEDLVDEDDFEAKGRAVK